MRTKGYWSVEAQPRRGRIWRRFIAEKAQRTYTKGYSPSSSSPKPRSFCATLVRLNWGSLMSAAAPCKMAVVLPQKSYLYLSKLLVASIRKHLSMEWSYISSKKCFCFAIQCLRFEKPKALDREAEACEEDINKSLSVCRSAYCVSCRLEAAAVIPNNAWQSVNASLRFCIIQSKVLIVRSAIYSCYDTLPSRELSLEEYCMFTSQW